LLIDPLVVAIAWILPYFTVAIFVGGVAFKEIIWLLRPMPVKWALYPVPASRSGRITSLFLETFTLSSLRRASKGLWIGALTFHAALALIVVGHFRVFSAYPDYLMKQAGITSFDTLSLVAGGAAGLAIFLAAIYLLGRRLSLPYVKEISDASDYMDIILLMGVFLSGNYMRFFSHVTLDDTRAFFMSLASFTPKPPPGDPAFILHFFLAQIFLMYLPFSKLMHFIGLVINQRIVVRR
jgi:nitrate reductase gamma subunit